MLYIIVWFLFRSFHGWSWCLASWGSFSWPCPGGDIFGRMDKKRRVWRQQLIFSVWLLILFNIFIIFFWVSFFFFFLNVWPLSLSISSENNSVARAENILTVSLLRGKNHIKRGCPGYDTKLHLMVRVWFWISWECGICFHYLYSQFRFDS